MQTEMQNGREQYEDENVLDLWRILEDYVRCLKKYWVWLLLLLVMVSAAMVTYLNWSYKPSYTAQITYAVDKNGDAALNASLAKRLSMSVTTLASTSDFAKDLEEETEPGGVKGSYGISSAYTEGTNLFTVVVASDSGQDVNKILRGLIEIYPKWASQSNGTLELQTVDLSESSGQPANPYSLLTSAGKGVLAGGALCFLLLTFFVQTLKTVRRSGDMKTITTKSCITRIPEVKTKKRAKSTKEQLLISQKRIDWGFKQAVLSAQLRIEKQMERAGQKVLLVSSTLPQEGKSVTAVNLALAFAKNGKKILVIDGDLRNPSVGKLLELEEKSKGLTDYFRKGAKPDEIIQKKGDLDILCTGTEKGEVSAILEEDQMQKLMELLKAQYDYIVIDTPPSHFFTDAFILSAYADAVLYVVRYDVASREEIIDGISNFVHNQKLLGYLINRNPGGFSTYGKYGYSRYRHYGKYKRYLNPDEASQGEDS